MYQHFSSLQSLSCVQFFVTPWTAACQASLSITNSWSPPKPIPLSQWCHLTVSSSVIPFSSCPQSFQASGSFEMSQLFASGGQNIGVSASISVLPNEHPGLISFRMGCLDLLAVQGTLKSLLQHHSSKAPLFGTLLSLWFSSTIFTWPLANRVPLLQASRKLFFRENTSTTSRRQKMLSKTSSNPETQVFMLQE